MSPAVVSYPASPRTAKLQVRRCEDCGAVTTEAVMPGMHGTHLALVAGRIVTVNCAGRVVP